MEKTTAYFALLTLCVFGFTGAEVPVSVSVIEGDSVTLNTGVTIQQNDSMLLYFNDIRIAFINGEASKSCLYDGEDGRFRDIVEVDYKTGSLTITNTTTEHAGRYEAELIRSKSPGTSQSLNGNRKCDRTKILRKNGKKGDTIQIFNVTVSAADPGNADSKKDKTSGLSTGGKAGISVVAVLLVFGAAAAAGVIYYRRRRTGKDEERRKRDVL